MSSDVAGISRVELEHRLLRDLELDTPETDATADVIRSELASRTWQGTNPYAAWPYTMFDPSFAPDYD